MTAERRRRVRSNGAFTLMELALVLVISGLMVGTVLRSNQSNNSYNTSECRMITQGQLAYIKGSIENFARSHNRLPIPARRWVGENSPAYGREAIPDDLTEAGGVMFGALPFQALGIPMANAGDCWGNKFTYIVTTALTNSSVSGGYPDSAVAGIISRKVSATLTADNQIAYAVISHGPDGLGAVKLNYDDSNATSPQRKWCEGSTAIAYANCLASAAVVMDAAHNEGKDAGANYFDDLVVAMGKAKSLTCNLPWGGTIANGSSVTAYQAPTGPCVSETRTCTDGVLSGSFTHQACNAGLDCPANPASFTWDDANYSPPCDPSDGGCIDLARPETTGCSATGHPALTNGETRTIWNATPGINGSLNVTCNNGVVTQSMAICRTDGSSAI